MSELSDSTPTETATSVDDPAVGQAPEVGESGPAGPAEQLQGADAGQMLSDGDWNPGAPPEVGESGPASPVEQLSEPLWPYHFAARWVAAATGILLGLQVAGNVAGKAESIGDRVLRAAGDLTGQAERSPRDRHGR
jgi:hypothetical protein